MTRSRSYTDEEVAQAVEDAYRATDPEDRMPGDLLTPELVAEHSDCTLAVATLRNRLHDAAEKELIEQAMTIPVHRESNAVPKRAYRPLDDDLPDHDPATRELPNMTGGQA